jgi:hypothetical protein
MPRNARIDDGVHRLREATRPCRLGPFDRPHVGRVLVEREMGSCAVIIREVCGQSATQVPLTENDDVVEALAPHRADEPLHERICKCRTQISSGGLVVSCVHVASSPSARPGLSVGSGRGAPSSCFSSLGSAVRGADTEGGLSGVGVGCGAVDAGGREMPLGAAWGREGVAKSLPLGGSGASNPLPSTILFRQ